MVTFSPTERRSSWLRTSSLVTSLASRSRSCTGTSERRRSSRSTDCCAFFEHGLSDDELEVLGILRAVSRLDPGHVALGRSTNDSTETWRNPATSEAVSSVWTPGICTSGLISTVRSVPIRRGRRSRRSAWLPCKSRQDGVTRSERLGLRHHDDFRRLHVGADVPEVLEVIRRLVRGLHTIQGASGVKTTSTLHLVDPAFGRSGSHSVVIARSIKINHLDLWTESKWWRELQEGGSPSDSRLGGMARSQRPPRTSPEPRSPAQSRSVDVRIRHECRERRGHARISFSGKTADPARTRATRRAGRCRFDG